MTLGPYLVAVPASGVVKCVMHLGVVTALVCRFALVTPELNLFTTLSDSLSLILLQSLAKINWVVELDLHEH